MPCYMLSCRSWCYIAPMRTVSSVLLIFTIAFAYMQRACFNISIVEFVKPTMNENSCPLPIGQKSDNLESIKNGKKNWDELHQAIVLATFYVGYVPLHLPVVFISERWGARWPIICGLMISSTVLMIMPKVIENNSYYLVSILWGVAGLGQSTIYPAITSFLLNWIPINERDVIGGDIYAGSALGITVGTLLTGYAIEMGNNWEDHFSMWGIAGLVFIAFFVFYVYSYPETHPNIVRYEQTYLVNSVIRIEATHIPFKKIIFDVGVWGLIFGQLGHNFVFFSIVTNFPKYMNNVLRYNITGNALASSLPHLASFVSAFIFGRLANYWINKRNAKVSLVRKLYTCVSIVGTALFSLIATLAGCNRLLALISFTIALFFNGLFYCSMKINYMDISHRYAGILMAICNGFGALAAVATPFMIVYIVDDNKLEQWRNYFLIILAIALLTSILYCIMGRADRRKWDYTAEELPLLTTPKEKVKWYLQNSSDQFLQEKVKEKASIDLEKKLKIEDGIRERDEINKMHEEKLRKEEEYKKNKQEEKNKKSQKK